MPNNSIKISICTLAEIIAYYIIYRIVSYRIMSYHIIPYHVISYHISYHIISYHIISYIVYHIISYHKSKTLNFVTISLTNCRSTKYDGNSSLYLLQCRRVIFISCTFRPLYSVGKCLGIHWIKGRDKPWAGLEAVAKSKNQYAEKWILVVRPSWPRDRISDQSTQARLTFLCSHKQASICLRSADVTEYDLIKEMILEKSSRHTHTHTHTHRHRHKATFPFDASLQVSTEVLQSSHNTKLVCS